MEVQHTWQLIAARAVSSEPSSLATQFEASALGSLSAIIRQLKEPASLVIRLPDHRIPSAAKHTDDAADADSLSGKTADAASNAALLASDAASAALSGAPAQHESQEDAISVSSTHLVF